MSRHLVIVALAVALAACGGGGYSGPGKNLVGEWEGNQTLDFTNSEGSGGSTGGFGTVTISVDGEALLVEDSECAYPAMGDGDDGLVFLESDGCIKQPSGDALRFHVSGGTGTLSGRFLTLELTGTLSAVIGTGTGTFTLLVQAERAEGGGEEEEGGGGGGDGDRPGAS